MSSLIVPVSRKRPYTPNIRELSDLDEDDVPPLKLKKHSRGHSKEFPAAVRSKLTNFACWVSTFALPYKGFFKMALNVGLKESEEPVIVIDDDDDDIGDQDVIPVKEVKEDITADKLAPLIEKFRCSQKLSSSDSKRHPKRQFDYLNGSHSYSTTKQNGSSSRYSENGSYSSRQAQTVNLKRPAVISNPVTDIDVLLGSTPKAPANEADVIEVLSESPIHKKQSSSQKYSRSSSAAKYSSMAHASSASKSSLPKSFTANEVVRLQEKAQYKLLLEKYISSSRFHPIVKKSQSDAEMQADSSTIPGNHFKKEVLQQPVSSLIEKYYDPCRLLSREKEKPAAENKEEPVEITIDDDEEDEVEILSVKLPKYKPKYRSMYLTPEWLCELKENVHVQTAERMKIVQDHERVVEQYKKDRLLQRLSIDLPGSQAAEPEFPKLTPEMEEAVDKALAPGNPEERLCKITSDYLTRKDFETLSGLKWLNDLVINSYFDLIVERSKKPEYPSIHAYNTFFYGTYKTKGYAGVRRWTRKLDIFSFDLNFVPIHLGVHWCLAVIDHRSKQIRYYDSMGTGEEKCLDLLHEYLCLEYKDKKGQILDPSIYTTEVMTDIPQQMNGSDCGMFTLKYAEYISRDAEINFDQDNMQYFRRRMVYELLTNQLL